MASGGEVEQEDEMYVLVELAGVMGRDWLEPKILDNYKLIGVDKEKPIMQIENYVFVGEYEDMVGTALLFEETDEYNVKGIPQVKYKGKTMKKLCMNRAFLSEKGENAPKLPTVQGHLSEDVNPEIKESDPLAKKRKTDPKSENSANSSKETKDISGVEMTVDGS